LPIKAVQFTILSIIALGYKAAVAPYYGSEVSSKLLQIWKTQRLIKRYSMLSVVSMNLWFVGDNASLAPNSITTRFSIGRK
jgi:hypothetical protein